MTYFLRTKIIIFFSLFYLFYTSYALSKNTDLIYSEKNISNYFSGIIAINQNNTSQAFKFFKKIQPPQILHPNFNVQFLRTLVLLEKFDKSFAYVKNLSVKEANFAEANLLLGLNYYISNDYSNAEKYFKKLDQSFNNNYYLEGYFGNFLTALVKISQNDKIGSLKNLELIPDALIDLKKIQETFIHCHFDSSKVVSLFTDLINDEDKVFSRYNFFLINYLLSQNKNEEAKKIIKNSRKKYNSNLLLKQTEIFMLNDNNEKIRNFFDCKNPTNVISEIFYVMANLYSTQKNYQLSNFYLKISLWI